MNIYETGKVGDIGDVGMKCKEYREREECWNIGDGRNIGNRMEYIYIYIYIYI